MSIVIFKPLLSWKGEGSRNWKISKKLIFRIFAEITENSKTATSVIMVTNFGMLISGTFQKGIRRKESKRKSNTKKWE